MVEKKPLFDQDSDRKSVSFPTVFPVTFSHAELPTTQKLMDESGMAYGCIVTPFITDDSINRKEAARNYGNASRVARCSSCAGYLNPYCDTNNQRWFCSLCGQRNVFARTQTRYRQTDLKLLPETQDVLVDYRMPIVESVDPLAAGSSQYSTMPADLRPLVHVFLVQESMKLDSLQSVVESLSHSVPTMHPDIKIILLTFSNRVGIYNFSEDNGFPTVQYVHFTAASAETGETSVLSGHDMHEIAPAYEVSLMMPLSAVAGFHATAARVGSCSEAFASAMTSLFDSYPAETPFSNNDDLLPRMMLGPVLDALSDWILDPPSSVDADDSTGLVVADEDDFHAVGSSEDRTYGATLQDGLTQIFSKLGFGKQARTVASANSRASAGGSTEPDLVNIHNRLNCPIDLCNGVILHVFADSPQNLKPGSHESVAAVAAPAPTQNGDLVSVPPLMDADWTEQIARRFAEKSLTVNLWAVTSYEGQDIGLSAMDSLAHLTGGSIHRTVLGFYPKDERDRLTEALRRSLNAMQATRCLLKLRASPVVEFLEHDTSGGFLEDRSLPGVYRVASCSPERAFGFPFTYKANGQVGHPGDKDMAGNAVAVQIAFSYETLIENDKGELVRELVRQRDDPEQETSGGDAYFDAAVDILELTDVKSSLERVGAEADFTPGSTPRQKRYPVKGYKNPSTSEGTVAEEVSRASPYNRSRALMAVKYLRIVTVMVECSSKTIRLFQCCHMPTMMSLVTRQAFRANRRFYLTTSSSGSARNPETPEPGQQTGGGKLNVRNEGIKVLVNFAIQMLIAFAKCSLAAKMDKAANKMTFEQLLRLPNIDAILSELQDHDPLIRELAIQAFATMDLLDALLLKSAYHCDALSELNCLLHSLDAYNCSRLFYPRLVPLSHADLMLEKYSIPLSREAMLTQAGQFRYFLLDAGQELILYKSLVGGGFGPTAGPASAGDNDIIANFRNQVINNRSKTTEAASGESDNGPVQETVDTLVKSNKQMFFLLHFLRRRIQCSPIVPKVYLCDAGTQSSSYFTSHLLEERCRSGLIEFKQFKRLLIDIVKSTAGKS